MSDEIKIKDAHCTGLSLQVPVQFGADEATARKSDFLMEAYTGQIVERWWGRLAIEMSGIEAKKAIPILRDHKTDQIVGFSNDAWVDGSFYVSGRFSKATPHAGEVRELAKEGFPWQASIGVAPKKVLRLDDGESMVVNGLEFTGPGEVWRKSKVLETSFVPLGADDMTGVSVFSRFDERERPEENKNAGDEPAQLEVVIMNEKKDTPQALTIEQVRAEAPEVAAALMAEGAAAELARIRSVSEQSIPGHEAIIAELMYDGKTSGPEAAVKVLAAERKLRANAKEALAADAIKPVAAAAEPAPAAENPDRQLSQMALEVAREKGISVSAALKQVARANPALANKALPKFEIVNS